MQDLFQEDKDKKPITKSVSDLLSESFTKSTSPVPSEQEASPTTIVPTGPEGAFVDNKKSVSDILSESFDSTPYDPADTRSNPSGDKPDFFSFDSFNDMRNSIAQNAVRAIGDATAIPSIIAAGEDQNTYQTIQYADSLINAGEDPEIIRRAVFNDLYQRKFANNPELAMSVGAVPYKKDRSDILRGQGYGKEVDVINTYLTTEDPNVRKGIIQELTKPSKDRAAWQLGDRLYNSFVQNMPVEHPEAFRNQFVGGVANAVTTVVAGLVAGPAGPMTIGMGQNAKAEYLKALEKGATEEQALKAAEYAGATGMVTEAIPVGRLLRRADEATGGGTSKLIWEAAKAAAAGATEEALTEEIYNVVTNLVASDIVKYDPKRHVFDGVGDNVTLNMSVGGFMNAVGYIIGAKVVNPRRKDSMEAQRADRAERAQTMLDQTNEDTIARQNDLRAKAKQEGVFLPAGTEAGVDEAGVPSQALISETAAAQGLMKDTETVNLQQQEAKADTSLNKRIRETFTENAPDLKSGDTVPDRVEKLTSKVRSEYEAQHDLSKQRFEAAAQAGEIKFDGGIFSDVIEKIPGIVKDNNANIELTSKAIPAEIKATMDNVLNILNASQDVTEILPAQPGKPTGIFDASGKEVLAGAKPEQTVTTKGEPLTLPNIIEMRRLLGNLRNHESKAVRRTAGEIRNAIDLAIEEASPDLITGDTTAKALWDEASKGYKDLQEKFGQRKQDSIVAKLMDSKSREKAVADMFGASEGSINNNAGQWMDELKNLGDGPGSAYEIAQNALMKRVQNIVAPSDQDVNLGTFVKKIDGLLMSKGDSDKGVLKHLPGDIVGSLRNLRDLASARKIAIDTHKNKDALLYLTDLEKFVSGIEANPANAGQVALSVKIAIGKYLIGSVIRNRVFKDRKAGLELGRVDPEAQAINTREADAKTRLERTIKLLEEQDRRTKDAINIKQKSAFKG